MSNKFDYKKEYEAALKSLESLGKILNEFSEYTPQEDIEWNNFKIAVSNFEKFRQKRINDKTFDPDNPFN